MSIKQIRTVYFVVFLTGLFSLVYQNIWQRYMTFLVGADASSSTITLTVFLAFLSIGYWLAGVLANRYKRSEIKLYGLVEIVIGVWAILFPWFIDMMLLLLSSVTILSGFIGSFIIALLLMALPATLMGITLPVLTQGLSQSLKASSRTHALIYGVNTIGACLGSLLAGFYLIHQFGLAKTLYVVGGFNVFFGLYMLMINPKGKQNDQQLIQKNKQHQVLIKFNRTAVYVIAAMSGYLLIGFESYFIRIFSQVTDGSNHAYPTVITAFIAAVGIAGFMTAAWYRNYKTILLLAPVVMLIFWILIYLSVPHWSYADLIIKQWVYDAFNSYHWLPVVRFLSLFIMILIPVVASSMLLPLSFHILKNSQHHIGKTVGNLYAISTLGTVLGGVVGGFLIYHWLNYQQIMLSFITVVACMMLVIQVSLGWSFKSKAFIVLVLLFTLPFAWLKKDINYDAALALGYYFQIPHQGDDFNTSEVNTTWLWQWFGYSDLLQTKSKPEGHVAVLGNEQNGSKMIAINGRSNSGTTGLDYQGNALLSIIPYVITEQPKRVLVVGVGTGVTAGAIANQTMVESVDVVEINQAVIDVAEQFDFANFQASRNSKINFIYGDAVKFLLHNQQHYDVIVSIPSNFWVAGVENLMMSEFYALVAKHLNTGGTFVQWIPDYDFSEAGLKYIIASYANNFDGFSLMRLTEYDLMLINHERDFTELPWVKQRLREKPLVKTLQQIKFISLRAVLDDVIAQADWLNQWISDVKIHAIDSPVLGETARQALYDISSDYQAEKIIKEHMEKKRVP